MRGLEMHWIPCTHRGTLSTHTGSAVHARSGNAVNAVYSQGYSEYSQGIRCACAVRKRIERCVLAGYSDYSQGYSEYSQGYSEYSHVQRGPAKKRKKWTFLRAVSAGGKRAGIESERNSPNARVRAMPT